MSDIVAVVFIIGLVSVVAMLLRVPFRSKLGPDGFDVEAGPGGKRPKK